VSSGALHNLIYALNQVIHNFGAAGVIGFATYGLLHRSDSGIALRPAFLGLVIAWAVQGASGAAFGIYSFLFYGKFPDIHGVAVVALVVKMICVATGFFVALIGFKKSAGAATSPPRFFLILSIALAATALSAAAFLRWFS
jgi:hypothetical protein